MAEKITSVKLFPLVVIALSAVLFICSFIKGYKLVQKSEKELNSKKQIEEAQAKEYSLKEIDAKTGQIRWKLTAREGTTEGNLQAALIKDIKAQVYKDQSPIFDLSAPYAKGNVSKKEIYLYGDVTAKDYKGNFMLTTNQLSLGMGTQIEAQKGFYITLKNTGTLTGENALINDDQTQITVSDLKEANFENLILKGKEVNINRDKDGSLLSANITGGGTIILKKSKNDILTANTITWTKDGKTEAINDVVYKQSDKSFKAGYLSLNPDKTISAKNNVSVIHGKTRCYANSLRVENDSLVTLTGNPKAFQEDKEITALKIIYDTKTNKLEAIGNVRTISKEQIAKK